MGGPDKRLAAILSADIVGYSRLIADDEDATVRAMKIRRRHVERLLADHRGELSDFVGDAFLAVFGAVSEALRAAVAIQRSLAEENSELPESRRVQFRIGVQIGDLRVEPGAQLFGDAVNVAARLQAIAPPGGICISGTVHDLVRRTPGLRFEAMGPQELKNIPDPVEVYSVRWSEED